jgi:hypothetical protein
VARGKWIRGKLKKLCKKPDCRKEDRTINSRDKVSLEFVQVDVEGTIETEGRSDGRDDLRNQSVQVCKAWLGNAEARLADVVDGLIVNLSNPSSMSQAHESHEKIRAMNEQSACSSVVCVVTTELYGSTTEEDNWGAGYTQNSSFDFLP